MSSRGQCGIGAQDSVDCYQDNVCAQDGIRKEPSTTQPSAEKRNASSIRIAIFCVGNKLMLDDGVGTAVFEELHDSYVFPDTVELHDVGCMSLDMVGAVDVCDYVITVDAVDGTAEPPGTIFEFSPDEMEPHRGATASLHELTLSDLFEAAALLGYEAEGKCFGMQVENLSPAYATIGLTPAVDAALPLLVDCVLADLYSKGVSVTHRATGCLVTPGWHHECV